MRAWLVAVIFAAFAAQSWAKDSRHLNFADFYRQTHEQTLARNFPRFRGRIFVSRDGYRLLLPQERAWLNSQHALVFIYDRLEWFLNFNENEGVRVSTQGGSNLQFDVKFYEDLRDLYERPQVPLNPDATKLKAFCVLPRFDKCIMLDSTRELAY